MKIDLIDSTGQSALSKKNLELWIKDELQKHSYDNNWLVEVLVVDKLKMRLLNKKYRQIDKATDVLSFPQFNPPHKEGNGAILGSIVLCPEAFGEQKEEELVRHGVKHLIGIHHK